MSDPESTRVVAQPVRPIPPRFWWLKRIALAAGAWLLLLVVARLAWGWYAARRLDAVVAAYRAAGEPTCLEDLAGPDIAPEANAAVLYNQAIAGLVNTLGEQLPVFGGTPLALEVRMLDPKVVTAYPDAAGRLIQANAAALELARQARGRPECAWRRSLSSPVAVAPLAPFAQHRQLTRLLGAAALHHHLVGNDAEAVESLHDALAYADRLRDPASFLIEYLVALACTDLVYSRVEVVCPNMRVALDDSEGPAARRGQLDELILHLLDETAATMSWDAGWVGERVEALDTVQAISEGRLTACPGVRASATTAWWEFPLRLVLSPLWRLDTGRQLTYWTDLRAAGHAADWAQAQARGPGSYRWPNGLSQRLHYPVLGWPFSFQFDYGRLLTVHYRSLARRRMAATALAIRLYEIDRDYRPAMLAELVPAYLPALPADPFAPDGGPIRYLPDGDPRRLYSVGENGVDDGAPVERAPSGEWYTGRLDVVFVLECPQWPATTQPTSTQAVEDDRQVESAEGQEQGQQPQGQGRDIQQEDP